VRGTGGWASRTDASRRSQEAGSHGPAFWELRQLDRLRDSDAAYPMVKKARLWEESGEQESRRAGEQGFKHLQ
jgi:hypothetical protein